MRKFKDEIVLAVSVIASYILVSLVKFLDIYALWGSLICIIIAAFYFSVTFFEQGRTYSKLLYFLIMTFMIIGYFALIYFAYGIVNSSTGETENQNWLNSFYFSVVTWTTLGYGDYHPIDDLKIWVMAEALFGYLFMGLLVGKILYLSQSKFRESDT